jgi:hypothetical protein
MSKLLSEASTKPTIALIEGMSFLNAVGDYALEWTLSPIVASTFEALS